MSLLPPVYQSQISPILLSNTNSNNAYNILFTAQYQPAPNAASASGTFLLTVASGTCPNVLQQVSLPSNVSTSLNVLNAQGLIAGIGTITTGTITSAAKALLLVPVEFGVQAGEINYGFDPPMGGLPATADHEAVPPDPPGEPVWTSVVSGSTSSVVAFTCPASIASTLSLHVTSGTQYGALVSPGDSSALSSGSTNITISESAGLTSVETLTIQPCTSGTQSLAGPSLNAYVLPARTVSVGIYDVIDLTSSNTYDVVGGIKTLANAPSNQTIINTLDDIFKQAGVSFQLTGSGVESVAYDVNKDGKTDEDEATTITQNLSSLPGVIHIYLTKSSGVHYGDNSTSYVRAFTGGNGNLPYNMLFVNTIIAAGGAVDLIEAHEMGHALGLTTRNPDDDHHDPGPFPNGTAGLMESGAPNSVTGAEPANPGRWLPHEDWKAANDSAKNYHP